MESLLYLIFSEIKVPVIFREVYFLRKFLCHIQVFQLLKT